MDAAHGLLVVRSRPRRLAPVCKEDFFKAGLKITLYTPHHPASIAGPLSGGRSAPSKARGSGAIEA